VASRNDMEVKLKKHYPWLWFDADGTLFDYNRAETTALLNAFHAQGIQYKDTYLETYQSINHGLWQALERREITQDMLRIRRFELLLEAIHVKASPEELSITYVEQLGLCADLIDGAFEVLETLHKTCKLAIVTNGLTSVQRSRFALSSIKDYIVELIISEEIGIAKPHADFFTAAFTRTGNPPKDDVLIIGDSLSSDIKGGVDYGIDTCWFNPSGAERPTDMKITYEIKHLRELLELIE
jgi:2-haloacid dehalogenase